MPADRIDIATASDRLMAERVIDAVKKKDVDALAAELAGFRARALSVALLRVEQAFQLTRVWPEPKTTEPVEKDPRQAELFDGD